MLRACHEWTCCRLKVIMRSFPVSIFMTSINSSNDLAFPIGEPGFSRALVRQLIYISIDCPYINTRWYCILNSHDVPMICIISDGMHNDIGECVFFGPHQYRSQYQPREMGDLWHCENRLVLENAFGNQENWMKGLTMSICQL